MAVETPKDEGILSKAVSVFEKFLDARLEKASEKKPDPDFAESEEILYRKSAYKDSAYSTGVQGYQEKAFRLSFQLLREMARRDTVVSAVIQNYQNDIADFAKPAKAKYDKGFKIVIKDERKKVKKMVEKLFGKKEEESFDKAEGIEEPIKPEIPGAAKSPEDGAESKKPENQKSPDKRNDAALSDREKERIAREELAEENFKEMERIKELIMNCGSLEDRSFEDKRWNFESMLRAIVRDSLTYDQYGLERVFEKDDKTLHHWIPVDGCTIRFATPAIKQNKGNIANEFGYNILFPEKEIEAMEQSDAIVLDETKLEDDQYKWVQVIRGKIERAFTEKELCVGMRNPTTDIYANGYSIPELEILMNTISSHIFTENYNRLYFTQGFSAKGILHIKAPLPRRKLEAFRIQWNHLLKGNKNSFQTPIVSGMEDIQWIPLTQNHSDMEFANWMNYLIKVICSLYQIDPVEIGFGMKEEGRTGGGLNGDNTKEKIHLSKEKGLKPLITHFQSFINQHLVSKINPEFELIFVGLDDESQQAAIERQQQEVKFKKTVNEIRAEDDLAPLEGADKLILDPTYMAWYTNMSPDGMEVQEIKNQQMIEQQSLQEGKMADPKVGQKLESQKDQSGQESGQNVSQSEESGQPKEENVEKSLLTIEHYTLPKE